MKNFEELRDKMVEEQIIKRGIKDADVIEVMRRVPRHKFVPEDEMDQAYQDCPLPIGEGQTISQPFMVALMTECLQLGKEDFVLEIGTGSGYQTAILAELSQGVISIEKNQILADRTRKKLMQLQYHNIHIFCRDGTLRYQDTSQKFNAIIVTAGAPSRINHLLDQLYIQGRIVIPIGNRELQTLMLFIKGKRRIIEKKICDCVFVPLVGQYGWN